MFVALDLPEPITRRLTALDPGVDELRRTPPERLHLTLCFLGDVAPPREEVLKARLSEVTAGPFPLTIAGVGCFGGRRGRPLVLWAGVEDDRGGLSALHVQIKHAAQAAGLNPDDKPFRAHVTLGRSKNATANQLADFIGQHPDEQFGRFTVTRFTLYHSILPPAPVQHRAEFRQELRSGG